MKYWVRTSTAVDYIIHADRFDIINSILHFYDEDSSPVWVIKDWVSFHCEEEEKAEANNPDEFYDSLKEDE